MITIKLPYTLKNKEDLEYISNLQRQYSSVLRWSFNRFKDKLSEKDIRHLFKDKPLKNLELIDTWFLQSAIYDAKALFSSGNTSIFGSKENFRKRSLGKISKEEFKQNRNSPISIIGECPWNGNRKFKLNIIEENSLEFRPKRGIKIGILLPKLRNNLKKTLSRIQELCENKKISLTIKLDKCYIYFTYDETLLKIEKEEKSKSILNRYAGIDLNPNYISVSIFENEERIISKTYNLFQLTKKSKEASSSKKSKYLNNKLDFETIEISKDILKLLKHYNCSSLFLEDLNIKSENKNKGTNFNRLCNNVWKKNKFVNNLKKRCNLSNIKVYDVLPYYSSFIGNLTNLNLPDPVAASCEIARRGYNTYILKNKQFYPELIKVEVLKNLWKEDLEWIYSSWKELFVLVKNSKLKYRVPFSNEDVFRILKTKKTKVIFCYHSY
jgi:hypothetical protein